MRETDAPRFRPSEHVDGRTLRALPAYSPLRAMRSAPQALGVSHPNVAAGAVVKHSQSSPQPSNSPLPLLLTTRLVLPFFPFLDAFLVPHRPHGKLTVGARYAPEVPPRQVRKHRVSLEAQALTQSRCV